MVTAMGKFKWASLLQHLLVDLFKAMETTGDMMIASVGHLLGNVTEDLCGVYCQLSGNMNKSKPNIADVAKLFVEFQHAVNRCPGLGLCISGLSR